MTLLIASVERSELWTYIKSKRKFSKLKSLQTKREREIRLPRDLKQCDQSGRFFKVRGDMVSIQSSPNAWWFFGLKWKATLFILKYCGYFLGNFRKKLGFIFNSASGHSLWSQKNLISGNGNVLFGVRRRTNNWIKDISKSGRFVPLSLCTCSIHFS